MGPDIAGLSEAEKQHPFWRTGLGAAAARRQVSMGIEPFVLTHCSLLTAHCSLLTAHCSLLTIHQGVAPAAEASGEAGGNLTPSDTAASAAAALAARARLPPPPPPVPAPRGLYIHGDVGGGKTLVIDMFAQAVAPTNPNPNPNPNPDPNLDPSPGPSPSPSPNPNPNPNP
jgi:hypothetical protein